MRKRTDKNQVEIVNQLRKNGYSVRSLSDVGCGMADIIVGYQGNNYLFEIKDPSQPPSARKLTKDEEDFHKFWRGQVDIIENAIDAIEVIHEDRQHRNKR